VRSTWGLVAVVVIASCKGSSASDGSSSSALDAGADASAPGPDDAIFIPSSAQRAGDASKGYDALVNNGYVGCGVPYSAYSLVFGAPAANLLIPGRNAANAKIPYNVTRFTTADGVDVVGPNCLTCHASLLLGKVVVGLGDSTVDFTTNYAAEASYAQLLVTAPNEKAELTKFLGRATALAPYIQTTTIGVTPADNIAAVLFSHHDVSSLAWSDSPILTLPPKIALPVDVPPWWRMSKKNAMFYTAAGRGDHARIMMTSSTLCIDSVDIARSIDAYFADVRAYVESLTAPKYPFAIDQTLAASGKTVFESTCSSCHGTYGDGGRYPNLVIPTTSVGTDATLTSGVSEFAPAYVDWFNHSFYGEIAHLDSQQGYYAPPLDGIWATAPFLHNGSVPSLATLLDSTKRPKYWTRTFDSNDFDQAGVGWNFTTLKAGQDDPANASNKTKIYDTTKLGYANAGHTYGDVLSDADRKALLEYLKTL
jgi:mono/diheme cytochrome c family protein